MPEITRKLVHVRASGHGDLVARLVELGDGSIVIGSPASETHSYQPGVAEPIDVGLITADGVVWYPGVVAALEPGTEACLRVKLGAQQQEGVERRTNPRAPNSLPVDLTSPRIGATVPGRLVDVSTGGVRVEAPLELEVGDIVSLTVHAPGASPIQATARVVHVHDGMSTTGLEFQLAIAADRDLLVRRAFERLALVGWPGQRRAAPQG